MITILNGKSVDFNSVHFANIGGVVTIEEACFDNGETLTSEELESLMNGIDVQKLYEEMTFGQSHVK